MGNALPPIARAVSSAGVALLLAGCPSEPATEPRHAEARQRVTSPAGNAVAQKPWLQPTDATAPDVWLASRVAGKDIAAGDPEVRTWHVALADADERFGETDRMIANRAVQLQGMLREIGIEESVREIIADFAPLAARGSRSGFSDLCQHYFNLRSQGASREAALARLRREGKTRPVSASEDRDEGVEP